MENELYHHGILGMRWGVRRSNTGFSGGGSHPSKSISRSEVKKIVKDYNEIHGTNVKAKDAIVKKGKYTYNGKGKRLIDKEVHDTKFPEKTDKKKDPLSEMSTKDIQEKVQRLNLEAQYKKLTEEQKTTGQKFVDGAKNVLMSSVKDAAKDATTNFLKKAMNNGMNQVYHNLAKSLEDDKKK